MQYKVESILRTGTSKNGQTYYFVTLVDTSGKKVSLNVFKNTLEVGDILEGEIEELKKQDGTTYAHFKFPKKTQDLTEIEKSLKSIETDIKKLIGLLASWYETYKYNNKNE